MGSVLGKGDFETYINENEITGASLEDIKSRLYARFKNSYQILNQRSDFVGGFLGFGKKHIIRATYKVLLEDPQKKFDIERQKLLTRMSSTSDSAGILQMTAFKKQLESLEKSINTKLDKVSSGLSIQNTPDSIKKITDKLQANDFSKEYIKNITERLSKEFSLTDLEDAKKVEDTVVKWVIDSIKISKEHDFWPPHIVVLVGPTGVGKTSTVSKMAVFFARQARKKFQSEKLWPRIKMITTDRIRMGAEEQLKAFCDVLDFPIEKAEDSSDLEKVLSDRGAYDYIFIDTNGCSPKDVENIARIKKMLDVPGIKFDIYLVISADKRIRDIRSIIQNYEMFGAVNVIVTKMDETDTLGNVISVLSEKEKQIAYIGTGQNISSDFEKATTLMFLTKLADFNIDKTLVQNLIEQEENLEK